MVMVRSVRSAARAKDSLRLEEDADQNDETDTDTSVLLYNLVRRRAINRRRLAEAAGRRLMWVSIYAGWWVVAWAGGAALPPEAVRGRTADPAHAVRED